MGGVSKKKYDKKRQLEDRKAKGRTIQNAEDTKRTKVSDNCSTTTVKPQPLARLSSEEKCDLVAELSELVLENPTKAFQLEKQIINRNNKDDDSGDVRSISKVQQLLDFSRTHKNGNDEYIASLAIMSLLAIFKDILPSYRIRQQTDIERA